MSLSNLKKFLLLFCAVAVLNANATEPYAKTSVLVIDLFDSTEMTANLMRVATNRLRVHSPSAKWTYLHATTKSDLRTKAKNLADSLDVNEKFTHVLLMGHGSGAGWAANFYLGDLEFSDSDQEAFEILKPLHTKMDSKMRVLVESCLILNGSPEHAIVKAQWLAHALGIQSFELFGHQFTARPYLRMLSIDSPRKMAKIVQYAGKGAISVLAMDAVVHIVSRFVQSEANSAQVELISPRARFLRRALVTLVGVLSYVVNSYGLPEEDDMQQIGYVVTVKDGVGKVKTMPAYDYFWTQFLR